MRELTVKETATALRKHLKATFSETKFSVVMSKGTGHGWISVKWNDGPTPEEVNNHTKHYQSERFDGRDDGYHPTGLTIVLDGEEVKPNSRGINTYRHLTEAAYDFARERTPHTGPAAIGDVLEDSLSDYAVVVRYPSDEQQALRVWLNGFHLPF